MTGNRTATAPTLQSQPTGSRSNATGPALVLACYDRTDSSIHAVSYAAGIAERTGGHLVVLCVDESMGLDCPTGTHTCLDRVETEVRTIVEPCNGSCDVAVHPGDAVSVIRRVAADLRADLIVVGRPRHPLLHPFGSIPTRLVRHAAQPVIVVP